MVLVVADTCYKFPDYHLRRLQSVYEDYLVQQILSIDTNLWATTQAQKLRQLTTSCNYHSTWCKAMLLRCNPARAKDMTLLSGAVINSSFWNVVITWHKEACWLIYIFGFVLLSSPINGIILFALRFLLLQGFQHSCNIIRFASVDTIFEKFFLVRH